MSDQPLFECTAALIPTHIIHRYYPAEVDTSHGIDFQFSVDHLPKFTIS